MLPFILVLCVFMLLVMFTGVLLGLGRGGLVFDRYHFS